MVDKAPEDFPNTLITRWKAEHTEKIDSIFQILEYESRKEARGAILPILEENKSIFEGYGPETDERFNLESDQPAVWHRKIVEKIIPINKKILMIIEKNIKLLTEPERTTVAEFKNHIHDFECKHIGGIVDAGKRFPV